MITITSRNNEKLKNLAQIISDSKTRREQGVFACDGLRLCLQALRAGLAPDSVFCSAQAQARYKQELAPLLDAAPQCCEIPQEFFNKLSGVQTPQGIIGVFALPEPCELLPAAGGRYIIAHGLQNPGNIGAVLRCAEAFGLSGVFLSADCPDIYSPKVLAGSMGAVFTLKTGRYGDILELIADTKRAGVATYATALVQNAVDIRDVKLNEGAAVVIGNEGSGLPAEVISACGGAVIIPMRGTSESLNAAAAAAIIAWEMTRR